MESISLKSIQDIHNHKFDEFKRGDTGTKIKFGGRSYTVKVVNDEVSVSRDLSNIKHRILNAISDFFSRMFTSGEHATETRANTLKTLIQSKNPTKMEHLTSRMEEKNITHHHGRNRDVYINHSSKRGYKFPTRDGDWTGAKPYGKFNNNPDLRLNDIYKSKDFYNGKYANLATHKTMKMDGMDVPVFNLIPNSKPLGPREKIPLSTLKMMEKAGFKPHDTKPDNFVKVKNDQNGYEYLPIDAKQITKNRSYSFRTLAVEHTYSNKPNWGYGFYNQCVDMTK